VNPTTSDAARKTSSIRAAGTGDIPVIRDLLTLRDSRAWDDPSTAWFVQQLEPDRCIAWIGFVNDEPAALSTLYRRELVGPAGPLRAGYWANLFVHPEHRDQMLYPRIASTMFAAARSLDLDLIYGGTRQKDVAFGHTRIGFTTIGTVPLLIKPLRPFRLLAKFKRWPFVATVAPPLDALWAGYLGVRRGGSASEVAVAEAEPAGDTARALVGLLDQMARDRIVTRWTVEAFHDRYRQTREGTRYSLLVACDGWGIVGGLLYRVTEREPDIRAGVIMDVIASPERLPALRTLLAHAERRALADGCELLMFLSGAGPAVHGLFTGFGYRAASESYDLQIWPKPVLARQPMLADLGRWRFAFGDHDAF
jgi:hypothetical protein